MYDIDSLVWLNVCLQDEMQQIPHSELTDLELIGQGGYGRVYRAKHKKYGNVAYKEFNVEKLRDRYWKFALVLRIVIFKQYSVSSKFSTNSAQNLTVIS